jgi:translation elongation factor EF-4
MPVLLLGNKADLGRSEVPDQAVANWAQKHRIKHSCTVSAKTGLNVEEAVNGFVKALMEPENCPETPHLPGIRVGERTERSSSCCA